MQNVDLNLLYTLDAFVEQGSLAGAARALSRSEPAISARLHQLEVDLGVRLFEKVGRRLALTSAGRAVHHEAQKLVRQAYRVVDVARDGNATPTGRLRIGALPTVGLYTLAPRVGVFVSQFETVSLEIPYGLTPELVTQLLAGELDAIASVGQPPDDERLIVLPLAEVVPVAVVRVSDHSRRVPYGVKRLGRSTLLEWTLMDDPFFDGVSRFLRSNGLADRVRVQVGHITTLKALVRAGAGVAILPEYTVVDDDLRAHPIPELELRQPMWFAYRRAAADHAALCAFRDLLFQR